MTYSILLNKKIQYFNYVYTSLYACPNVHTWGKHPKKPPEKDIQQNASSVFSQVVGLKVILIFFFIGFCSIVSKPTAMNIKFHDEKK